MNPGHPPPLGRGFVQHPQPRIGTPLSPWVRALLRIETSHAFFGRKGMIPPLPDIAGPRTGVGLFCSSSSLSDVIGKRGGDNNEQDTVEEEDEEGAA